MTYKGYRILANAKYTRFYEIDKDGDVTGPVEDIGYDQGDDSELWYSVIDKDDWVIQSFETVEECKQAIRELQ